MANAFRLKCFHTKKTFSHIKTLKRFLFLHDLFLAELFFFRAISSVIIFNLSSRVFSLWLFTNKENVFLVVLPRRKVSTQRKTFLSRKKNDWSERRKKSGNAITSSSSERTPTKWWKIFTLTVATFHLLRAETRKQLHFHSLTQEKVREKSLNFHRTALVCVCVVRGMIARRRSFQFVKKQTQNVPKTTEKVNKPQI